MSSEIATVYHSNRFEAEQKIIPFSELNPLILDGIKRYCAHKKLKFIENDKTIFYNGSSITYYLNYSPSSKRYFLCFLPKNVWKYSSKSKLIPAFNNTIQFFKELKVETNFGGLTFVKSTVSDRINIFNWKYTTLYDHEPKSLSTLSNSEIQKIFETIYSRNIKTINRKLLIVDSSKLLDKLNFSTITNKVKKIFKEEPEIIEYSVSTLEQIEIRSDKSNLFILFIGHKKEIDKCYSNYKKHFISNEIPSQFVTIENISSTLNFGISNFIYEIIKKTLNENAIILDPISYEIDGYLCLSDIGKYESNKLFGVSISFTGKGTTEDFIEIYNDIGYSTKYDRIFFNEGQLHNLSRKIEAMSGLKNKEIDILVSRRWKVKDVGYICSLFEEQGIKVGKFLYISSKTNKFLFEELANEDDLLVHPFILWDERTGAIQTNSKVQLYGTMFPIYVELLNPWDDRRLLKEDLQNILWLVKKRIYRINNFYNLKVPELISLFEDIRKLNIEDLSGKLKVGINFLL